MGLLSEFYPITTPAAHRPPLGANPLSSSAPPRCTLRCHSERSPPGRTESRNLPARQSTLSLHSLLGAPNPPVTALSHRCTRCTPHSLHTRCHSERSLPGLTESRNLPARQSTLSLHSLLGANPLSNSLSFRAESAGADGVEESPRPAVNPVTALSPRCKPAVTPHSHPAAGISPPGTRCHSERSHTRCHSRSLPGLTESRNLPARQSTLSLHSLLSANPPVTALSHRADGVEESPRPAVNPVTALSPRCKPAVTPHSPRCTPAVIPSGVCRG